MRSWSSARPGLAYFDLTGLEGIHGGEGGVIAAAGKALVSPPRIGAGPTRFCALAAALEARSRRARVIRDREARGYLASQPISYSQLPGGDRAARARA